LEKEDKQNKVSRIDLIGYDKWYNWICRLYGLKGKHWNIPLAERNSEHQYFSHSKIVNFSMEQ
jgi:hypothetical protein